MPNKFGTRELDKRSAKRTRMVLGLRLPEHSSHAADLLVHTLDITDVGAKIGALREGIQPGSVIVVQRKHTRVRCLVMWSRKLAPGEVQIGVKFIGRVSQLWGLDLDDTGVGVWFSEAARD